MQIVERGGGPACLLGYEWCGGGESSFLDCRGQKRKDRHGDVDFPKRDKASLLPCHCLYAIVVLELP